MIPPDAAEPEAGDREGAGIDVHAADGIFSTNIEAGKDSASGREDVRFGGVEDRHSSGAQTVGDGIRNERALPAAATGPRDLAPLMRAMARLRSERDWNFGVDRTPKQSFLRARDSGGAARSVARLPRDKPFQGTRTLI
jgi:hypothetical protein